MQVFYEAANVPVHSVLLMRSREEALAYPKGTIRLGFCNSCGFISNTSFDASLHEYSSQYEETQSYSPTFNEFHTSLAQRLINTYNLHGKIIIEIGCGKGEFLMMLCEMGNNRGVGVDPAYVPERNSSPAKDRVTFINDLYSEKYTYLNGDFFICKMTLEHIHSVNEFVGMIRRSIGTQKDAVVFFQIPNVAYVLRDVAFWDIYYEHCSYFSAGSVTRLLRRCGFDILSLSTAYNDQYLTIEAKPSAGRVQSALPEENDLDEMRSLLQRFTTEYPKRLKVWNGMLQEIVDSRKKSVIWGAGSKGVSFLTKLNVQFETMPYAVDVNPYKRGTFMAGTGQQIVAPEFLREYQPDTIIIMNPIYKDEIRETLDTLGVRSELVTM
ncbi:methyltransferase domain-containing protein [Sphingobacteriales bacterium CHB3]|nr:methyltransferase domain-containing protein [Sphingobacteriales bacterium CHB3]